MEIDLTTPALLFSACLLYTSVKSLERSVPGQGKVTIHQDARIAALIGSEYILSLIHI